MPDIDSLPAPYSSSHVNGSDNRHSPSPRASTSSLAAAATINAGFHNEDSRRSSHTSIRNHRSPTFQFGQNERRRSNAFLSSYDPALPGPGELQTGDLRQQSGDLPSPRLSFGQRTASPQSTGSPTFPPHYRDRTPSLGEIHQQLEQEQEAQVIRLLAMIRHGQAELQAIREQAVAELPPPVERSASYPYVSRDQSSHPVSGAGAPRASSPVIRGPFELTRESSSRSRTPSRTESPSLRNTSAGLFPQSDDFFSGGRSQAMIDENAYYQAETQNLTRENQMLRQRIRELERQLSEGSSTTTNSPVIPSNLSGPPMDVESSNTVLASEAEEKDD